MHVRTSLTALLCVLTMGAGAIAQSSKPGTVPPEGKKYTLQECVTFALVHNSTLIRSGNEIRRSATYKTEAVGQFIPDLSASASWSRSDQDSYGVRGGSFYSSRNSYSYMVRSGLVLFDGMRNAGEGYRVVGELTNTDRIMNDAFWIGVYPGVTDDMREYVAESIEGIVRG